MLYNESYVKSSLKKGVWGGIMKITLIDGTYEGDKYLVGQKLMNHLSKQGHEVSHLVLAKMKIAYCQGCWSCWVATPGRCIHQDDTQLLLKETIQADVVIYITENKFGTVTSLTKKALDKFIPLVHPHIVVKDGASRHKPRYDKYPKWGVVVIDSKNDEKAFQEITRYMGHLLADDPEALVVKKLITDESFSFDTLKIE